MTDIGEYELIECLVELILLALLSRIFGIVHHSIQLTSRRFDTPSAVIESFNQKLSARYLSRWQQIKVLGHRDGPLCHSVYEQGLIFCCKPIFPLTPSGVWP